MFVEMATSIDLDRSRLTRMNEAGVFGKFLRDFGRVVGADPARHVSCLYG